MPYECHKHGTQAGDHCPQCAAHCYMPSFARQPRMVPAGHPNAVYVPDYFEPGRGAHMEKLQEFVVGLAFSAQRDRVVLIKKKRGPDPVVGKWNGPGGHVEDNEEYIVAMMREFKEETGVATIQEDWTHFLTLNAANGRIHFFHMTDNITLDRAATTEDEMVGPFFVSGLPPTIVPNLRWIIPMALGHLHDHVRRYEVTEAETV